MGEGPTSYKNIASTGGATKECGKVLVGPGSTQLEGRTHSTKNAVGRNLHGSCLVQAKAKECWASKELAESIGQISGHVLPAYQRL